MAKEKMNLANERIAEQSRNKTALIGFVTMNSVLAVAYFLEVIKNARSLGSYLIVAALCIVPTVLSLVEFMHKKDSGLIRYISSVGFALLYCYVMFTTSSDLAF